MDWAGVTVRNAEDVERDIIESKLESIERREGRGANSSSSSSSSSFGNGDGSVNVKVEVGKDGVENAGQTSISDAAKVEEARDDVKENPGQIAACASVFSSARTRRRIVVTTSKKKKKKHVLKKRKRDPAAFDGYCTGGSEDDGDFALCSSSSSSSGGEEEEEYEAAASRCKGDLTISESCKDDWNIAAHARRVAGYLRERSVSALRDVPMASVSSSLRAPAEIYEKLFDYQRVGVNWLWGLHQQGVGGILGDEMGLGKTVQIAAFLACLKCADLLRPSIIVCPATMIGQWANELRKWFPPMRVLVMHSSGEAMRDQGWSRVQVVASALRGGDVILTTYQGLRISAPLLLPHQWGYIILDEGHKIRNPDAGITLCAKKFRSVHRIILSGAPIQNNLKELWSLFDFVFPGRLGTLPVFDVQFAAPINAAGYLKATPAQIQIAFQHAKVLKESVDPYLLRRLKKDVRTNLPEKVEQVLFCNMTPYQRARYREYLNSREVMDIMSHGTWGRNGDVGRGMFGAIRALQKICNHPDILDSFQATSHGGLSTRYKIAKGIPLAGESDGMANADTLGPTYGAVERSGKMLVLDRVLRLWSSQGHRALVFTQGTKMLDILESHARRSGYTYARMDGSTNIRKRQPLIDAFNKPNGPFLFLLTTRVGGLGVNLIGADRVILYDPDWNPCTDMQARERVWRIGQTQQVTIYRLMLSGTIEEKMYHRQIFKQYLSHKILQDPRQRRFFKYNSFRELFTLDDHHAEEATETSALFRDGKIDVPVLPASSPEAHASSSSQAPMAAAPAKARKAVARAMQRLKSKKRTEDEHLRNIPGVQKLQRSVTKREPAAEETTSHDVISDLMKIGTGNGQLRQAFDHDSMELGNGSRRSKSRQRLELIEARRIAQRSALILRQQQQVCQRSEASIHLPTFTGSSGTVGASFGARMKDARSTSLHSSNILERIRNRANASAFPPAASSSSRLGNGGSDEDPRVAKFSRMMMHIRDYLSRRRGAGGVPTEDILQEFGDRVDDVDAPIFKEVLRMTAKLRGGLWHLRKQTKTHATL